MPQGVGSDAAANRSRPKWAEISVKYAKKYALVVVGALPALAESAFAFLKGFGPLQSRMTFRGPATSWRGLGSPANRQKRAEPSEGGIVHAMEATGPGFGGLQAASRTYMHFGCSQCRTP